MTLMDKTELVAFGLTIASAVVGVNYLLGIWPFTRINKKEYHILQWITGNQDRTLQGPGTRWFFWPIERKVKRNGDIVTVTAQHEQIDMDLKFRSADGLEGMLKIQYLYSIPSKEDAEKYFWDLNNDVERIKEILHGELLEEIGNIPGMAVSKGGIPNEQGIIREYYTDKVINKLNKIRYEREDEPRELYAKYGVQTESIKILNVDFDEQSQAVLRILTRAREIATAKKVDSLGTLGSIESYTEAARQIQAQGSSLQTGDIMRILMDYDNNIKVAESGGTINKFTLRP